MGRGQNVFYCEYNINTDVSCPYSLSSIRFQISNVTPEKDNTAFARRVHVCATCGYSTMASEPKGARLLWNILSFILPIMFGHMTACCSPALAISATIHYAMKRSTPCSAVLHRSPSSSAAVVHLSALMPTDFALVYETPH